MSMVYEYVKENIIKKVELAIENGENLTWVQPWEGYTQPMNFITKKPYRGINALSLSLGGNYMTFKQVKALGGKIKKGASSELVYFWSFKDKKKDDSDDVDEKSADKIAIFRYYKVFHQSCIEGIDFPNAKKEDFIVEGNSMGDLLIRNYSKVVPIENIDGVGAAFYNADTDCITLPTVGNYINKNEYYATAFHEIIHSTGHKDRLARELVSVDKEKEKYSKEELIAELGSSLLSVYCGTLDKSTSSNSIAYIKGWLSYLKNSKASEIVFAAQRAQKAYDYVLEAVMNEAILDVAI